MAEKVISILLSAKDATASAFDRAKGGIKSLSDETQMATSGMKAATEAVSKAMRGDLVGAAQSAASAFKALWAVVLSNPIAALAAAAAALAVGLYKLWQNHKEAEKAAKEHAESVADLRKELEDLTSGTLMDKVKEQAKALANEGNEIELRKRIQAIKDYAAALSKLADKQLADIGLMTNEDEIAASKKEYGELIGRLKDLKSAQKEYEGALGDVVDAHAKVAAAEKDASDQALANKAALKKAEREFRQEIEATFNEYELQQSKQNAAVLDSEAAIQKQTARTLELMGATDAVTKAEIERKHIQEDIAEMMSGESADTIEFAKKQAELSIKEAEIAKAKEEAAKVTEEEGKGRIDSAKEILKTEKEIKTEKQRALTAEAKARGAGWRQNDPWGKKPDPWDALKNKPQVPPPAVPQVPPPAVPPLPPPQNAGAGGRANDPWSTKLDAIKTEITGLRGDLTGGAA